MSLPLLKSDFIAHRRTAVAPWLIAALGVLAAGGMLLEQRALIDEAAGLELKIASAAPAPGATTDRADQALNKEARTISQRLATPWGAVLDDLEAATRDSGDSIAVLSVQPDRDTHRVTLVAEARSLPAVLSYVQRLQKSKSLRYPLLDSHEVRNDSAERPVRVQITAEWKLPS